MKRIKDFAHTHIITFSFIVTIVFLLIESIDWDGNPVMGYDAILLRIMICVFALLLMKNLSLLKKAEFGRKGFAKGFLLGLPILALGIVSAVFSNLNLDLTKLGSPVITTTIIFTLSMFMVGSAEEIVFRGLLLNNMIEKWGTDKRGVIKAITLTALIFGGSHIFNAFVFPLGIVIVQTINAITMGLLFSVIYLRCRNLSALIIVHMLVDWFALFMQNCFTGTTSIITTDMSLPQALLVVFVGSSVPLVLSVFYLRKYKYQS